MTNISLLSFEAGPDNSILNEANTGADNISNNNAVSDNAFKYLGTYSAWANLVAGTWLARKDITATGHVIQGLWVRMDSLPSATCTIMQFTSTGANRCQVRMLSDGTVQLRNNTTAVWDSVSNLAPDVLLAVGREYWFEHEANAATSSQRLRVYDLTAGGTLLFDTNAQTFNSGATINECRIGPSTTVTWNVHFDRWNIDDSTFLGPIVTATDHTRTITDGMGMSDSSVSGIVGILKAQDFDYAAAGTQVTTTNAGYPNITSPGIFLRNEIVPDYTGGRHVEIDLVADLAVIRYDFATPQNLVYHGAAFCFAAFPDAVTQILTCRSLLAMQTGVRLLIGANSGKIALRDGTLNTTIWTSDTTFALGQPNWYWIEEELDCAAGTVRVRISDLSGNLIEDSGDKVYSGTPTVDDVQVGSTLNSTVHFYLDRHRVAIGDWTGPLANGSIHQPSVAESLGLTDSIALTKAITINDTLTIPSVAAVNSLANYSVMVNDTVGMSDSPVLGKVYNLVIDDVMTVEEPWDTHQTVSDVITELVGATDATADSSLQKLRQADDTMGLSDSLTTGWVYARVIDDSVGLSDNRTVFNGVLHTRVIDDSVGSSDSAGSSSLFGYVPVIDDSTGLVDYVSVLTFTLTPLISDVMGLRDSVSVYKNGVLVTDFSSINDQIYAWLISLGYSGSIQDMQYAYLRDRYIATIGALPTGYTMTSADFQVALGKKTRDLILQDIASGNNFAPVIPPEAMGLSDSITITGDLFPNIILNSNSQVAGTSKNTASWTPKNVPRGRMVYLVVWGLTAAAAADPSSIVGNGLTWNKIMSGNSANLNLNVSVWAADTTGGTTGTIAITFAASQTAFIWCMFEAPAIKLTGNGLKQAVPAMVQNASTTPSVSLGSLPLQANLRIGIIAYNAADTQTCVPEAGWAALMLTQLNSNSMQGSISVDQGSPVDQSAGWVTLNASGKVVGVMELEAA